MEIYSWNVNGIRSAWGKGLADFFFDQNPDILCLQEVKAYEEQFPDEIRESSLLKQRTHHLYTNCASKAGYAGVAVLTREKPIKVCKILGHGRFDNEGRMLRLDYNDFSLFNFYLPHGGRAKENLPYKLKVYDLILGWLKENGDQNVVLVGDFNIAHEDIDLARPQQNINNIMFTREEREKLDRLISLGYTDSLRQFKKGNGNYTWWPYMANARQRNLGWRIDYGFVSAGIRQNLVTAKTFPEIAGSDHCPISLTID